MFSFNGTMVVVIFAILLIVCVALPSNSINDRHKLLMEYAYYHGQKDAIEGKIKIAPESAKWKSSCWDTGETPTYNPSKPLKEQLGNY